MFKFIKKIMEKTGVIPEVADATTICVPWYTYDFCRKNIKEFDYRKWENEMNPNCILGFLEKYTNVVMSVPEFLKYNPLHTMDIKLVAIGDDYNNWIKEKFLTDTMESRMLYMNENSSEESTLALLKKEGYGMSLSIYCLVCAWIGEGNPDCRETDYKVDKNVCSSIKSALEKAYHSRTVWVPGYILTADAMAEYMQRLTDLSRSYFYEAEETFLHRFDTQDHPKGIGNTEVYFIPFVVGEENIKAQFNAEELLQKRDKDRRISIGEDDIDMLNIMIQGTFRDSETCILFSRVIDPTVPNAVKAAKEGAVSSVFAAVNSAGKE